ncbi:chorismate-binding protein [Brucella abortus]|nr:chorismate-binding protein [Brucella abortus]
MQRAHEAGEWLAGYLSYEAGYLLEPKLRPLLPEGRKTPLLCFGVFDGPSDEQLHVRDSENATYLRNPVAQWSFEDYAPRFERLYRHLREGDCYQGNLTFPVTAQWGGDPLILFNMLAKRQPVRYATCCDLGGPVVLSRSPELFFKVDGRRMDRNPSDERHHAARSHAGGRRAQPSIPGLTTRKTRPKTA